MEEKDKEFNAAGCLLTLLYMPFGIVLRALVIRDMWLWFVTPLGVAKIGYAHAAAISLLMAALTFHDAATEERTPTARIIFHVILNLWIWGWAGLLHAAMIAGY